MPPAVPAILGRRPSNDTRTFTGAAAPSTRLIRRRTVAAPQRVSCGFSPTISAGPSTVKRIFSRMYRFGVPRARFTDNTTHNLLRIVRELVANAIRHGRAKTVRIAGEEHDGTIRFSVRDDGCGFDPETAPGPAQGHFGLRGIRERLNALNGTLTVESAPGQGTKATVVLAANAQ